MDSTHLQYPALRRPAPSGRASSQSTFSGPAFLTPNIESLTPRLPAPSDHVSSQFTSSGSAFLAPSVQPPAPQVPAPSDHVSSQFTSSGLAFLAPSVQPPAPQVPAPSDHVSSQFTSSGPAFLAPSVQPPAPRMTNNSNLQQPATPQLIRSRLISSRSARSRPAHNRPALQQLAPRPQYFLPPSALQRQALQSIAPRSQQFLPPSPLSRQVLHPVAPRSQHFLPPTALSRPVLQSEAPPPQYFLPPSAVSRPVLQPLAPPPQSFLPPSGLSQPPLQSSALPAPQLLHPGHLPPAHSIQGYVPQSARPQKAPKSKASKLELELLMGLNFYPSPEDRIWDPQTGRGAYLDLTEDDMPDNQLSDLWSLKLPSETTSSAQPYLLDNEPPPSALKLPSLRELNLLNPAPSRPQGPAFPGDVLRPEFLHSYLHPKSGLRAFEPPILPLPVDPIRGKPSKPEFLDAYIMERVVIIKRVAFGESFEKIVAFLAKVGYPTATERLLYERMKRYMKKRGFTKVEIMKVLHIENFIRLKTKPGRPRDFGS